MTLKLSDYEAGGAAAGGTVFSTDLRQVIRRAALDDLGCAKFIFADGNGTTRHLVNFETIVNDVNTDLVDRIRDEAHNVYNGVYWSLHNGAAVTTGWSKFGTKSLVLSTGGKYVQSNGGIPQYIDAADGWTEEIFIKTNTTVTNRKIFSARNVAGFGLELQTNSGASLTINLSNNGTSWNISNGDVISSVLAATTEYHIVITFTNTEYKVYVNGVLVWTKASALKLCRVVRRYFGWSSQTFDGFIDEYRFSRSVIYTADFTVPSAAFTITNSKKAVIHAASDIPLELSFAEGSYEHSLAITTRQVTNDLQINTTNYLYVDYNRVAQTFTLGATPVAPQYGVTFDNTQHALLTFDKVDDSGTDDGSGTALIYGRAAPELDLYGNVWTASNIATKKSTTHSRKYAEFDGAASYMLSDIYALPRRWSMKIAHVVPDNSGTRTLMTFGRNVNGYGIRIQTIFVAGGTFNYRVYLSTNGTSWDVVDGGLIAGGSSDVDAVMTLSFDGTKYSFGTAASGVTTDWTSSNDIVGTYGARVELGRDYTTSYYSGKVYEFELMPFVVKVPAAFDADGSSPAIRDDIHFFNITTMEMRKTNASNPSGAPDLGPPMQDLVVRLFIGEVDLDDVGVTSVRSYAANGVWVSEWYPVAASNSYVKRHNLGTDLYEVTNYLNRQPREAGRREDTGPNGGAARINMTHLNLTLRTGTAIAPSEGQFEVGDATKGFYKTIVKRSF